MQIAQSALTSFEFFANTVMGSNVAESLCRTVQDVCEDQEDYCIMCTRPRALAEALRAWLEAQGFSVLTTVELPRTEILQWLQLEGESRVESKAVSLDVGKNEVMVQWL